MIQNQSLIFVLFQAKLLVTTGDTTIWEDTGVISEVIDLQDPTMQCEPLPDFPIQTSQGAGILMNQLPIICAGIFSQGCFTLGQNDPISNLLTQRSYTAGLKLDEFTFWVTGGHTLREGSFIYEKLSSTELVSLNEETRLGPELPIHVWGHCIAALDENSVILAGGVSNEHYSSSVTYIYNRLTGEWSEGPSMTIDRYLHQCASFKSEAHEGRNVVVAAGGYSIINGMMSSAEIFDPMNPEQGWVPIADLPRELAEFSMITSPNGNGVIASGGISGRDRQGSIYELKCTESGCEAWTELEQKIQNPRMNHVAVLVPDILTTCNSISK